MTDNDHFLGLGRVIAPPGALPQAAQKLDASPSRRLPGEIHIDVQTLNIDAASFKQMEEASSGNLEGVGALVRQTVQTRGKQHNPVTGSGGMLLGTVAWIDPAAMSRGFSVGQRVATLASLSLTPLTIDTIGEIRPRSAQVDIQGRAVVFFSAPLAAMPADLPERIALAAFDVAGAAPQVERLVAPGQTVLILGAGGKSGLLCAAQARKKLAGRGRIIGIESHGPYASDVRSLGLCDDVIELNAQDAPAVYRAAVNAAGGPVDVSISCVNVPATEMSAIVPLKDRGKAYFFAMSTSFTAAALGAEGIGKDVDLFIGNGFATGHAAHTLDLLRQTPALLALFEKRYG